MILLNEEIIREPIVLRDFSAVELYPKRYETFSNKHYLDIIYGLFEKFVFIVAISGKSFGGICCLSRLF
jgi:hypothetical protein